MIIQTLENNDLTANVSFQEGADEPYEITIQGSGREEHKTFTSYEDGLRWAAPIMEMPHLLAGIGGAFPDPGGNPQLEQLGNYLVALKASSFTIGLATDDTRIATMQGNGQLRYYDRINGTLINETQLTPFQHWAIAPSGQTAIITRGRVVEVWDLATMKQQRTISLPFQAMRPSIWPDNQTLAISSGYEFYFPGKEKFPFVQLYNLISGQRIGDIKAWPAQRDNVLSHVTFSPQKDWVTFGIQYDGPYAERIRLYILPTLGNESETEPKDTSPSFFTRIAAFLKRPLPRSPSSSDYLIRYQGCHINCAAFTHNAQYLFLGMSNSDHPYYNEDRPIGHHIHVWKRATGQDFVAHFWLRGHTASIQWLFVTPDDRWLISVSVDGNIHIWDINSGRKVNALLSEQTTITQAALNKSGALLALGDEEGQVVVRHMLKGQISFSFKDHQNPIRHMTFTEANDTLMAACETGTIIEWSLTPAAIEPKTICIGDIEVPEKPDILRMRE